MVAAWQYSYGPESGYKNRLRVVRVVMLGEVPVNTVEVFGPYRLEAVLGRGGMGEVFRAYDVEHGRLVAVKRLTAQLADDQEFRGRFRREASLAARLRNPHIVPIHHFGELEGHLFIDMRYVEGFDVADLLHAVGALEPSRAVAIVEQAACALDAAHRAGLVHRDVKPSNLLIDQENSTVGRDFVFLADFGISRPVTTTRSHSLTRPGALLGSLDYMAPEQFDGVVDKQADIYALGCVLFQLLTGSKPYDLDGLPALMHAHLHVPPPSPTARRPGLPAGFDEVIHRSMAKHQWDRYGSAMELADAARSALDGDDGHDGVDGDFERARSNQLDRAAGSVRVLSRRGEARRQARPCHEIRPQPDAACTGRQAIVFSSPAPPARNELSNHQLSAATNDTTATTAAHRRGAGRPRRIAAAVTIALAVVSASVMLGLHILASATAGGSTRPVGGQPQVATTVPIGQAPQGVALSPDAHTLYVANAPGHQLAVLDTATRTVRGYISVPGMPRYATVSRDGRRVFVSTFDNNGSGSAVAVVDLPTGAVAGVVVTGPKPYALATGPDGRIYVPNHDAPDITVIDSTTLRVLATIPVPNNPHAIAFSPTGNLAYAAIHKSGTAAVIDTTTTQATATIPAGNGPHSLAVSPDGTRVAVADYGENAVSIIDTATNSVIAKYPAVPTPQSLTYSTDGRYLYVVNESTDSVTTIDAHTGQVTATTSVGSSPRYILASPDGTQLYVTNSKSGTLTILRAAP